MLRGGPSFIGCAAVIVVVAGCGPAPGRLTVVDPPLQGDAVSTFVDFGDAFGGATHGGHLSYRNSGEGPVRFVSVTHESGAEVALGVGEFSKQPFLFDWPGETTVQPGDRIDFSLRFSPLHAQLGDNDATLTLTVENAQEPTGTIALKGHVVGGGCSATQLDFGTVAVGATVTQQLYVQNSLTDPATVSVRRTGTSNALFFTPPLTASKDLQPGQFLALAVTFAPTEAGEIKESLIVTYDALCSTTATIHAIAQ